MKLPPEPMFDEVFFLFTILPELEVMGLPDYEVWTKVLFCYYRILLSPPWLLIPPVNEFMPLFPLYIILSVWVLLVSPFALFLLFPPIPMLLDCWAYFIKLLYWELNPGWFYIFPVEGCLGYAFWLVVGIYLLALMLFMYLAMISFLLASDYCYAYCWEVNVPPLVPMLALFCCLLLAF